MVQQLPISIYCQQFQCLEYISEGAFKDLSNLRYLNLEMCNLKEITNILPLVRLEELEMSRNQIYVIKPNTFTVNRWMTSTSSTSRSSGWRMPSSKLSGGILLMTFSHWWSSTWLTTTIPFHDLFKPLHHLEQFHLHHNILLLPFSSQNMVDTCMLFRLTKQHLGTQKELLPSVGDVLTYKLLLQIEPVCLPILSGQFNSLSFLFFARLWWHRYFHHETKSCSNSSVKGWICTKLKTFCKSPLSNWFPC